MTETPGTPTSGVRISQETTEDRGWPAGSIIRDLALGYSWQVYSELYNPGDVCRGCLGLFGAHTLPCPNSPEDWHVESPEVRRWEEEGGRV